MIYKSNITRNNRLAHTVFFSTSKNGDFAYLACVFLVNVRCLGIWRHVLLPLRFDEFTLLKAYSRLYYHELYEFLIVGSSVPSHLVFGILIFRVDIWYFIQTISIDTNYTFQTILIDTITWFKQFRLILLHDSNNFDWYYYMILMNGYYRVYIPETVLLPIFYFFYINGI